MIYCYSDSGNSKRYAEVLGDIIGQPVYMLEAQRKASPLRSVWQAIARKSEPVVNMPTDIDGDEVYICGPVWGGYPAAPLRYFLENAPLRGKKVHMLLTAGLAQVRFIENAKKMLDNPGNVQVFVGKGEAVEEQIRELMT